jgi:hypothetical protein
MPTKSQLERDFDRTFKPQPRKHCLICGAPEGSSGDGANRRFLRVQDGWVCNYCNNQK